MHEETRDSRNPPDKTNGRWIVTPRGVLRVALIAAAFPVMGWFGGHHWTLDLCNHPQAQYFCFLALCFLTLAAWRKRRHALVCLALLMIPAAKLAPLYLPAGKPPEGPGLRVASFNILGTNTRYAEAAAWIAGAAPDFIYLPEANEEWARGLKPLAADYPHTAEVFIEGNFGFLFLSKFPIVRQQARRLGMMEIPLMEAVVSTPQGEVRVFGAHPVPPVTEFWANERDTYLRKLSEIAAKTPGHVILLGDLNATRWSHAMGTLWKQGLRDTAEGHGFSATWNRENPLMAIPIDHILVRGFSGTRSRRTGPATGSDHRPVIADLAW